MKYLRISISTKSPTHPVPLAPRDTLAITNTLGFPPAPALALPSPCTTFFSLHNYIRHSSPFPLSSFTTTNVTCGMILAVWDNAPGGLWRDRGPSRPTKLHIHKHPTSNFLSPPFEIEEAPWLVPETMYGEQATSNDEGIFND